MDNRQRCLHMLARTATQTHSLCFLDILHLASSRASAATGNDFPILIYPTRKRSQRMRQRRERKPPPPTIYYAVVRYLLDTVAYKGTSEVRATEVMDPGTCYGTGTTPVIAMSICRHACRKAKENHAKLLKFGFGRAGKRRTVTTPLDPENET